MIIQFFPSYQALQEQRAMVERMSLAPPAHIEIVDCYAHKGEIEDIHYTMPWILSEWALVGRAFSEVS